MDFSKKCQAKFREMGVEEVKKAAAQLVNDFRPGVDEVLGEALSFLSNNMPKEQFVEFCKTIEG